jgi:hypothetical protein
MTNLSDPERLSLFHKHQEKERLQKEKATRDSIDARQTFERLRRTTSNTA